MLDDIVCGSAALVVGNLLVVVLLWTIENDVPGIYGNESASIRSPGYVVVGCTYERGPVGSPNSKAQC